MCHSRQNKIGRVTAGQRAEDRVCKCGEQGNGGKHQIFLVDRSGTTVVKTLMGGERGRVTLQWRT